MWLLFWFLLLILLFLLPLGWGWGYRGWGPPRPYYLRRRGYETEAGGWGLLADLVWIIFVFLALWLILALVF